MNTKYKHEIKHQEPCYNGDSWHFLIWCDCGHIMSCYIGKDLTDIIKQEQAQIRCTQRYLLHLEEMKIRERLAI